VKKKYVDLQQVQMCLPWTWKHTPMRHGGACYFTGGRNPIDVVINPEQQQSDQKVNK
jgi:hypothetical protein